MGRVFVRYAEFKLKGVMPKPPLTEPNLDEIFYAFIDAELNPSGDLLKALAAATGKTEAIIRQHYVPLYRAGQRHLPPPLVG